MTSDSLDLLDFLDQFDADRVAGRERPLSDYLRQFPRSEVAVAREYLRLCAETGTAPGSLPEGRAPAESQRVGPFRLLRELGRGGQGTVHLAEDVRVGRLAALKVLAPGSVGSAAVRTRFRREAEAIARLDHPSLCSIYEADLDAETPYIAMRYVAGETLRERLHRARSAVDARPPGAREVPGVLRLIERTARALHAAHEAGIVHRDIKPGNIQLDAEGQPVVVDFGLARLDAQQGEAVTLTAPGQAFGTPAYMAPEQFARGTKVDRRADVYSLGITLYECLTLTLPGPGDGRNAADPSQSPPPEDPTRRNPAISGELRVVVETAMAIEPGHRYATALALAEDLRRLCEFEPIAARPASAWLRARRWCRRNRRALAVSTVAVALLATIAVVVVSEQVAARVHSAQQEVLQVRASTKVDPQRALGTALDAWARSPDDFANTTAIEALAQDHLIWEVECRSAPPAAAINLVDQPDPAGRSQSRSAGHEPAFAVADRRVCVAMEPSLAAVLDLDTGAVLARSESRSEISSVTAAAGAFFAVWRDGEVRRWDEAGGFRAWACGAPALAGRHVVSVTAAPGPGRRMLLITRERDLVLWDLNRETQVFALQHLAPAGPADPADHLTAVFSRDGAWLATGFGRPRDSGGAMFPERGAPTVWNVTTGALHWAIPSPGGRINCIDFAADGKTLAIAHEDGLVGLYDVDARRPVAERTFRGEPFQIQFHPDALRVVVCFAGGRRDLDPALAAAPIRVLDRAGNDVEAVSGHQMRGVMAMDFSPDGQWFASAGNDRRIVVRRAANLGGEPEQVLSATKGLTIDLQWLADNRRVVAIDGAGVACWDVQQAAVRVLRHDQSVCVACFDPAGEHIVTGTVDGRLWRWNRTTGALDHGLSGGEAAVQDLMFSRDGRWLVARCNEPRLRAFDAASWQPRVVELDGDVTACTLDDQSRRAAVGLSDGSIALVDLATFGVTRLERPQAAASTLARGVTCAAFARDGRTLLTGDGDRNATLWDVESGRLLDEVAVRVARSAGSSGGLGRVLAVLSLDDRRWLISTQDPSLQVWEPGGPLVDLRSSMQVNRLALHPNGHLLAIGASAGLTTLLRWPDRVQVEPSTNSMALSTVLRFGRTGRFLLSASYDGNARLLRTEDGPRYWAMLSGHDGPVLAADLSADERWVVTASGDKTARVWPTEPIEFCKATGRLGRFSSPGYRFGR